MRIVLQAADAVEQADLINCARFLPWNASDHPTYSLVSHLGQQTRYQLLCQHAALRESKGEEDFHADAPYPAGSCLPVRAGNVEVIPDLKLARSACCVHRKRSPQQLCFN